MFPRLSNGKPDGDGNQNKLQAAHQVKLTDLCRNVLLRAQEAHRKQNQVGWVMLLGAGNFLHLPLPGRRFSPLNFDRVDAGQVAVAIVQELLCRRAVLTRILAELYLHLLVSVIDSEIAQIKFDSKESSASRLT